MMRPGREQEITQLVQRLIDLLGSDEVAVDARHTPKLYSRFLADVLAKHQRAKAAKEMDADADAGGNGDVTTNPSPNPTNAAVETQAYPNFSISEYQQHQSTPYSGAMDVMPNVLSPSPRSTPSTGMDITMPSSAPAPLPSSEAFSFAAPLPPDQHQHQHQHQHHHQHHHHHQQQQQQQQALLYGFYGDGSPYMDVDRPLPAAGEPMLASLAQLTDPAFWEHGALPGFSWTTNPGAWPTAVDAALGGGGGSGYASASPGGDGAGGGDVPPAGVYSPSSAFSTRV